MNTNYKYDPEDIESLLMHKQFNELYEEEKEFVLQHVKNEEEYNSLRSMLFTLHDQSFQDEWLEPDPSIKKNLMKEFASEKKGGFLVWLNGIFAMPEITWYRRPAVQWSFAAVLILIGGIWFFKLNRDVDQDLASLENGKTKSDTISSGLDNNLFAENLSNEKLPPAPKEIVPMVSDNQNIPAVHEEEVLNIQDDVNHSEALDMNAIEMPEDAGAAPTMASSSLQKREVATGNLASEQKPLAGEKTVKSNTEDVKFLESEKSNEELADQITTKDQVQRLTTNQTDVVISNNATFSNAPATLGGVSSTTYNWDEGTDGFVLTTTAINTNSINASTLKDVISVLYTAP